MSSPWENIESYSRLFPIYILSRWWHIPVCFQSIYSHGDDILDWSKWHSDVSICLFLFTESIVCLFVWWCLDMHWLHRSLLIQLPYDHDHDFCDCRPKCDVPSSLTVMTYSRLFPIYILSRWWHIPVCFQSIYSHGDDIFPFVSITGVRKVKHTCILKASVDTLIYLTLCILGIGQAKFTNLLCI
jgi:hypothetical protein